jgi:hypothetical protein
MIRVRDFGEDLSFELQKVIKFFTQEILRIVKFLKKLDKYLVVLIYAYYQLEHICQEIFLKVNILIPKMQF